MNTLWRALFVKEKEKCKRERTDPRTSGGLVLCYDDESDDDDPSDVEDARAMWWRARAEVFKKRKREERKKDAMTDKRLREEQLIDIRMKLSRWS